MNGFFCFILIFCFLCFRRWLKELAIFDRKIEFCMQKSSPGWLPEVWKREICLNYEKFNSQKKLFLNPFMGLICIRLYKAMFMMFFESSEFSFLSFYRFLFETKGPELSRKVREAISWILALVRSKSDVMGPSYGQTTVLKKHDFNDYEIHEY